MLLYRCHPQHIPWWLWPNVLGLDAPLVALVWQETFARMGGTGLHPGQRLLLGGAIWQIYLLDRWLDARGGNTRHLAARHVFQQRHRRLVPAISFVLTPALAMAAIRVLSFPVWMAGLILGLATGFHLMLSQGKSGRGLAAFPFKEGSVGVIFALGCALIPWVESGGRGAFFIPLPMFACLCGLNCCFITLWEDLPGILGATSLLTRPLQGISRALTAAGLALGGIGGGSLLLRPRWETAVPVGCIGLSALALVVLNLLSDRIPQEMSRVLADAVLLTPMVYLIISIP